jgi:sodium transport system ATP-binding protein
MVEVRNLRKRFGAVAAVDGVSFAAADGQITGLLGENGAGKTTTLAMIGGVLRSDGGSVQIDGVDVSARPDARRRLGALLDHKGLYPRLTARENIRYFGELQGLSAPGLDERVSHMLGVLGLDALADRAAAGFSQGERMKVALARAVVHGPRNVLLDEPTNGLDIPGVRALRGWLREMRDRGICLLFSSHVLDEVRALCDRIVIISAGRVVAHGTVDAICRDSGCGSLEDAFVRLIAPREAQP